MAPSHVAAATTAVTGSSYHHSSVYAQSSAGPTCSRARPPSSHDRPVQLSLKLTQKTVEETERLVEASRKLLERPVYQFSPKRRDPRK